jgi:hypothetical protein
VVVKEGGGEGKAKRSKIKSYLIHDPQSEVIIILLLYAFFFDISHTDQTFFLVLPAVPQGIFIFPLPPFLSLSLS